MSFDNGYRYYQGLFKHCGINGDEKYILRNTLQNVIIY